MEDGLTPYLTLESNEYQLYMLKFASNVVQKLCDLLGGRGGGHQNITLDHRGEGGGHDRPKKDHIIVERSLISHTCQDHIELCHFFVHCFWDIYCPFEIVSMDQSPRKFV